MTQQSFVPIFIGGCPRSGTTLLATLLGQTIPSIVTPESQFKVDLIEKIRYDNTADTRHGAISFIREHPRFKIWHHTWSPRAGDQPIEGTDIADILEELVRSYGTVPRPKDTLYWIDHTPHNLRFRHELESIYPQAKFVHIYRDGRGVANSVLPLDWGPNTIDVAAKWWVNQIATALAATYGHKFERNAASVRYETLTNKPKETITRLIDELDSIRGPESHSTEREMAFCHVPSYTRSQHSLVGQAPDPERADAWRRELQTSDISIFEHYAGSLLSLLDYDRMYLKQRSPPPLWWRVKSYGINAIKRQLNGIVKDRRLKSHIR